MNFVSLFCLIIGSGIILLDLFRKEVTATRYCRPPGYDEDAKMNIIQNLRSARDQFIECYMGNSEFRSLRGLEYQKKVELCRRSWNFVTSGGYSESDKQEFVINSVSKDDISVTFKGPVGKYTVFACKAIPNDPNQFPGYFYIVSACKPNSLFYASEISDSYHRKKSPEIYVQACLEEMDFEAGQQTNFAEGRAESSANFADTD